MNPAAESWTGWRQTEVLGQTISRVFQLKGTTPVTGAIWRVLREGDLAEINDFSAIIDRSGAERLVGGTIAPVRDHTGKITGAVLVFGSVKEQAAATTFSPAASDTGGFEIVAEAALMKRVVHFARRVASSEASTILLEGESGTGKDVLAKFVHYHSRRQSEPFLAINCAAIPETLLESELFGYEKGAFTDAKAQKKGILELAHGGTVFLDEIGEMPLGLQSKLLRVLEDQTFRRLGGTKDTQVDLRVITATNRDLREAIQDGRFRLDLFYRLNVIQISVPALRDRREDIVPLANHFIRSYRQRYKRSVQGLSPEGAEALVAHDWPGNVRELRNVIERAMILEETEWIQPSSLGILELGSAPTARVRQAARKQTAVAGMSLEDAERTMLIGALEQTGWNQTRAASLLSIGRDALRYKMKKFNLQSPGQQRHPTTGE
jgi:PAS domain S-box-containing protein